MIRHEAIPANADIMVNGAISQRRSSAKTLSLGVKRSRGTITVTSHESGRP